MAELAEHQQEVYWRYNMRLTTVLLLIWFVTAYIISGLAAGWFNSDHPVLHDREPILWRVVVRYADDRLRHLRVASGIHRHLGGIAAAGRDGGDGALTRASMPCRGGG